MSVLITNNTNAAQLPSPTARSWKKRRNQLVVRRSPPGQRSALDIFQSHLDELRKLEDKKAEQQKIIQEARAKGAKPIDYQAAVNRRNSFISKWVKKYRKPKPWFSVFWSECRDSNSRPLEPHSSAIPNFATPGCCRCLTTAST